MSAAWIKVVQTGSPIRRHHRQRETLIGLGLNHIGRLRLLPDTPETWGMIAKVKHLVRVLDGPLLGEPTAAIKAELDLLRRFNRRVNRAEQSDFWKRYADKEPHVISRMENMTVEKSGPTTFALTGRFYSALKDFNHDEIAAFVLDYRQFTQRNDPISITSLSKIYGSAWMPKGARGRFEDARAKLNRHLDSPSTIMFGEYTMSLRTLVDTVVYGGLAHANTEKAEAFESWEKSGIMGLIWAEFFAYLRGLMETLKFIRSLNSQVIAIADPPSTSVAS